MFEKISEKITQYPHALLGLFFLIAIMGLFNLPKIKFDFTPQQLFKVSGDDLVYREAFADVFGREDNSYFVLIDTPKVYDPKLLKALRDTTLNLRQVSEVRSAESLVTLEIPRSGTSLGTLHTDPIVPHSGEVGFEQAEDLKKLCEKEPLVEGRLVNEAGNRTILMVWIDTNITDVEALQSAVDRIDATILGTVWPKNTTFRYGGIPKLRTEIVRNLQHQQLTFIPATGFAYFLVLLFLFRRLSGVLGPLLVVAISSLMITSVMVWTGSSINIINNIVPSLIFIIGISDSIHMLVRDAEEMNKVNNRKIAVKRMILYTGSACLLTSLTTAVGFFSLFMASTKILRDFGWQAGLGVMFAYLVTILVLPSALIFLKPVRKSFGRVQDGAPKKAFLEYRIETLARFVISHPVLVLLVSFSITAVFIGFATQVKIDTTLLEVYTEDHPSYKTTAIINREFGGILPFEISLESDEKDAFKDPQLFQKIHSIQSFATRQNHVLAAESIIDFHQVARAALLSDPAERKQLPNSRAQIEQLHLLIAGPPDTPYGVNRFVSSDFKRARILLRVSDAGSQAQMKLAKLLSNELEKQFAGTKVRYRITGDAYVASKSLDVFVKDLFSSLLLAALIIFFMMTLVFRSLKLGLVSILPNIIPLLLTFGYMGIQGINLNTTTVIIFAISLGLAVDDTIHFLARFEELRKKDDDIRRVLLGSYRSTGKAIILTSFMLLVGLVVLSTSDFLPTRQFAILTSFTIAGALLGDLFILPPILLLVFLKKKNELL